MNKESFQKRGKYIKLSTSSVFNCHDAHYLYKEAGDKHLYEMVLNPRTISNTEESIGIIEYFPDYIVKIDDVLLLPGTDSIIKEKKILSDRFSYDNDAETVLEIEKLKAFNDNSVILCIDKVVKLKGEYINLCYSGGNNIWHMTFDMLSKFRLINMMDELDNIPLLMDEKLKDSLFAQQYISCFNKKKHDIIYLKSNKSYQVDAVYSVSLAYIFMRAKEQCNDLFFISNKFIDFTRKLMIGKLHKMEYKKLYIKRGDTRLLNEEDVCSFLKKRGFSIVQPEKFSFYDELSLFYSAECIIGSIGAAFTNLLYIKPKCNVICISPNERIGLVRSYATITRNIGASLYHCYAETISNTGSGTPGLKFNAHINELEDICNYLSI